MVRDHTGTRYGEKEAHVVPSTEHLVPSFSWRSITKTSSRGRRLWIWSWRYMPRRNNSPLEKNSASPTRSAEQPSLLPSNIAEGQAHYSHREFLHFLRHSRGSLAELETQILIAERVKYIQAAEAEALLKRIDELGRILSGLIRSL